MNSSRRRLTTAVVGIEGEDDDDALALARRLVGLHGTIVLTDVAVSPRHPLSFAEDDLRRHHLDRAQADASLAHQALAHQPPALVIREDARHAESVGAGLHAAAREHAADVIVVGASRVGPPRRALAATHMRAIIDDAPCMVAIAAHDFAHAPLPPARIGAVASRRHNGNAVAALALELADDLDATLEAFEIADDRKAWLTHSENDHELRRFAADVDLLVIAAPRDRHGGLRATAAVRALASDAPCSVIVTPV